jgi:hypothetical protein
MAFKPKVEQQSLTMEVLDEAEKAILHYEQQRYFDSELTLLRMGKPVKNDSSVLKLDPIIDEGILRTGGRISQVSLKNHLSQNLTRIQTDLLDIHQQV